MDWAAKFEIEYRPSTAYRVADWQAGILWQTTLPFPVQAVSRITVHDANGSPDSVTHYTYRDGYYDGDEKEFRGFALHRKDRTRRPWDTLRRYPLHLRCWSDDESRKGLWLEKTVASETGVCSAPYTGCFRREVNVLATRTLHGGGPGSGLLTLSSARPRRTFTRGSASRNTRAVPSSTTIMAT